MSVSSTNRAGSVSVHHTALVSDGLMNGIMSRRSSGGSKPSLVVGDSVTVCWCPRSGTWYTGEVTALNAETRRFEVTYDPDGADEPEKQWHPLAWLEPVDGQRPRVKVGAVSEPDVEVKIKRPRKTVQPRAKPVAPPAPTASDARPASTPQAQSARCESISERMAFLRQLKEGGKISEAEEARHRDRILGEI